MLYLGFAEKYILSIYLVAKVKTKKKIGVSMHLSEQWSNGAMIQKLTF